MSLSSQEIEAVVSRLLEAPGPAGCGRRAIAVEASARHVHLNQTALTALFGPDAVLEACRPLSQPGQFLSDKRLRVVTLAGELANVAVLGPLRERVQVELSRTDCRSLGLDAPVNLSGNLTGAGDVILIGPNGIYQAGGSAIVARAHIHLRPCDAAQYGLSDGQKVSVEVESGRSLVFQDVYVRVSERSAPVLHIDFDEANACQLGKQAQAWVLGGGASRPLPACSTPIPEREGASSPRPPAGGLVTEARARGLLAAQPEGAIVLAAGTLVTPSARDVFSQARREFILTQGGTHADL